MGVRELRQNLSKYLDRVKAGEALVVTERGHEVARLVPSGEGPYADLSRDFGASVPTGRLEELAAELGSHGAPAGTTDAHLAESRADRAG